MAGFRSSVPSFEEVVAYVWMGQRTRQNDGGLLENDLIRAYGRDAIDSAFRAGLLTPAKRFRFETCSVSPLGERMARTEMENRVAVARFKVEQSCSRIPNGLLKLLVSEVVTDPQHDRARLEPSVSMPPERRGYSMNCFIEGRDGRVRHLCLLDLADVQSLYRDLLCDLVSSGLAVKVTSYFGTREARDPRYCLAPETDDLLRQIAGCTLGERVVPIELEPLHELFHELWRPIHGVGDERLLIPDTKDPVVESLRKEALMSGCIVASREPQHYRIRDFIRYRELAADKCLRPIVQRLSASDFTPVFSHQLRFPGWGVGFSKQFSLTM